MTKETRDRLAYAAKLLKLTDGVTPSGFLWLGIIRYDAASVAREVRAELACDPEADGYYCERNS